MSFLVGVESEFILLRETEPELKFVNDADWSCSRKTRTGSVEAAVLDEIAADLLAAGVEVQMYHAEAAPGQVSSMRRMRCAFARFALLVPGDHSAEACSLLPPASTR